jgi:hypothetical protein
MDHRERAFSLQDDPRWRRLHDRSFVCPSCSGTHQGLFDIAYGKPDAWPGADNSAALTSTNFLSGDICILDDQHYFVRCVLELRILGGGEEYFGFGVWSTLSKKNFAIYAKTFDAETQDGLGPWFGWFSNRLSGYSDTSNLKCQVHPRGGRQRPSIVIEPTDHQLAIEQRDGITFDRLLEIYATHGHDLRSMLSGAHS